jgi:N-acyl-D-amino-acid deacylase
MLDLVIKNGKIVDGSGNPWFYGDVGVSGGKIAAVGAINQEARRVIDAAGRVVCPGFIDGHCHSDLMILDRPESEIKLRQGVTAEVVGNCGLAPAPYVPEHAESLKKYVEPVLGTRSHCKAWPWTTVGEYMSCVNEARPGEHVASYVAHGSLRIAAMGFAPRPATAVEMDRMKGWLREGLSAGAIGLSLGLLYAPGSFAPGSELDELCRELGHYGGLLSAHIRGEGNRLLQSIDEVIGLAERAEIPLHISHLKAAGKRNWGQVEAAMDRIEQARARGLDVTCDVYPYSAGSTSLTTVLPPWVLEGGIDGALEALRDPAIRRRVVGELSREADDWDNLVCSTGWQSIHIATVASEANRSLEGRHIASIADERGIDPAECMIDLLLEEDGRISIVYFHMSDDDVKQVVAWDRSLIASDSLHCGEGKPHPRLYGTFPRLFAKYVRAEKALTLEQAVRKVTSFPAGRFKLGRRGLLVPGYSADLVVFDPDRIQDRADYDNPRQYPDGISHVVVAGAVTLCDGALTGERNGGLIRAGSASHQA